MINKALNKNFSVEIRKRKIVVLGSGWAGFKFLKKIDQKKYDVTVISPRNHFIFTPLLASTTVGTLEFRAVIEPTRTACKNYIQAQAEKIFPNENKIVCLDNYFKKSFDVTYDYLIIAVGATPNTFGVPGVKEYCKFLRTIPDAREIRKQIITCFEEASSPLLTEEERKRMLSFVVVGGGPTSCEFSAELHDFLESDIKKLYPEIDFDSVKIYLIESSDHILGMFDRKLSEYAEKEFKRQKIHIMTNNYVKEVTKNQVILKDGQVLDFGMCIWSTGNSPIDLIKNSDFTKDAKSGRILVDDHLKVVGHKNVFAIGDCANDPNVNLPQTAQCAQQEGLYLSRLFNKANDSLILRGRGDHNTDTDIDITYGAQAFKLSIRGIMTYIGDYHAIVDTKQTGMKGLSAWLVWRSYYMTNLLSFSNMILVPMYWFKAFVFGRDISNF